MSAADALPLNLGLAFRLAARSLRHRRMIALATVLGVAIGIGVVNAVLIVDANTARSGQIVPVDEFEAEELAEAAAYHGLRGETYDTVKSAYAAARLYAEKDDLIFVGGSIFVVAEVV